MLKIKENLVPFIVNAVAAILMLVGMISFFVTNGISGYSLNNGWAVLLAILAFVLAAGGTLFVALKGQDNVITAVCGLLAIICAMTVLGLVLSARTNTIGSVLSFDSGNQTAWSAVYSALTSIITFAIGSIVMIVAGFLGKK